MDLLPNFKDIQPKVVWGCWLTLFFTELVTLPFWCFYSFWVKVKSSGAKLFLYIYIYRYISIAWWIHMQCTASMHSDSISLILIWNGRREDNISNELYLIEKPRFTFHHIYNSWYHRIPFWILYSTRLEHCLIFLIIYINMNTPIVGFFLNYNWHNFIHQLHYSFKLAF